MALRTKRADGIDLTDPVEQKSMAGMFALSVLLLLAGTTWAIYKEITGLRPWKAYQAEFKEVAVAHYNKQLRAAESVLSELRESEEYRAAVAEVATETERFEATAEARQEIIAKRAEKQEKLNQVRADLKSIRNEYQAAIYRFEQGDEGQKVEIQSREEAVLNLIAKMGRLDQEINDLSKALFALGSNLQKARSKEAGFAEEVAKISGLIDSVESRKIGIIQYYVPNLDHATDRCASCHVGAITPGLEDVADTLKGMPRFSYNEEVLAKYESLFKSHPGDHLMKHPPEKFGCVSCHAGDGPSLTTNWEAHGTHHHHESPLHLSPTNAPKAFGSVSEAGCNKCHQNELDLPGAPLLSYGKQLFSETCAGCHKAKGIWPEEAELDSALKELRGLKSSLVKAKANSKLLEKEQSVLDDQLDKETINDEQFDALDKMLATRKDSNRIDQVALENKIANAEYKVADAKKDVRWIGPDLRNVKDKLRPDWIKPWLLDPHEFSEKTKMPKFYLTDENAEAIAAYLWQSASEPAPTSLREPSTDEATLQKGAKLVQESGCLACHVAKNPDGEIVDVRPSFGTGEDGQPIKKRGFGPALLRTGEKARYDWISRWVYDPQGMSPGTRMPNMRLRKDQTDAIAAWIATQTEEEVSEDQWSEEPDYLNDEDMAAKGYQLVQRNGCYSCHAIGDVPPESERSENWKPGGLMSDKFGRIGVELSAHGSKTLHLFDFGLIEHDVQANMWGEAHHPNMTRFDYIAYKVWKPRDFERGRYYTGPDDPAHLRMPSLNLSREEAHAVSTFVISLVEDEVPPNYVYAPGYPGGAVTTGRNLTVKHNCVSCHSMEKNRGGYLRDMYKDGDAPFDDLNNAPPTLVGEGRKVQPEWLFNFMKQPVHIRPWLSVRMPWFGLSDSEAQQISEYFQGYDNQAYPYVTRSLPPLTEAQKAEAAEVLVGQCQRCHSLSEAYDPKGQAPALNMVKDRIKPEWIAPWVLNPQRILPYTRMPALGLSPEKVSLVARYLQTLNKSPEPRGSYVPDELHRAHEPAVITEN